MNNLEEIFNSYRIGLNEVAENILSFLDYSSVVSLKRTCCTMYDFIKGSGMENIKERRKLRLDWMTGSPKQITLDVQGLVGCAKFFDKGRKVVVGVDQLLQVFDIKTGNLTLSMYDDNSIVKCVEVSENEDILASGSAEGNLALWDAHGGKKLVTSQLFGRIEVIQWKGPLFVTAHFGKAFDMGCISVRRYNSPTDFPVIYSLCEDLFPIFCMDFNNRFLAALEWSGTYNNVHGGNVNIYRTENLQPVVNLSCVTKSYTYTCCRFFGDILLTGGHDRSVRMWELPDKGIGDNYEPILLRTLPGHDGIIVRLEVDSVLQRAVSRDLTGQIFVWDLNECFEDEYSEDKKSPTFLRKVESSSRTITFITLEKRRLLLGSIGNIDIRDFWSSYSK